MNSKTANIDNEGENSVGALSERRSHGPRKIPGRIARSKYYKRCTGEYGILALGC